MTNLKQDILQIITHNLSDSIEPSVLNSTSVEILAMLDEKFSLVANDFIEDEETINEIHEIWMNKNKPKFKDIPIGFYFAFEGFNKKISETKAAKIDFPSLGINNDQDPFTPDPDERFGLAHGFNDLHL